MAQHNEPQHSIGWLHMPQNYFFSILYITLAVALAVKPVNGLTTIFQENINVPALALSVVTAIVFLVCGVILWRYNPTGQWYIVAALPVIIWCASTALSLIPRENASLTTPAIMLFFVYSLFRTLDMRLALNNNERLNLELGAQQVAALKEIEQLKAENAQLKAERDAPPAPLVIEEI